MNIKLLLLSPLAALAFLAGVPAYHFPKIDADEDGAVSWEEYAKIGAHIFLEADTDFDGFLETGNESFELHQKLLEADMIYFYRQADTNEDGYTDEAEFVHMTKQKINSQMSGRRVVVRSHAKDSKTVKADAQAQWEENRAKQEKEYQRQLQNVINVSVAMNLCVPDNNTNSNLHRHLGRMADCDQDGVVTMNEHRRIMKIRFTQKDLDEDGRLTPDEIPSASLFSF